MYSSRGAMMGSGGVSDGFEDTKRHRMTDSNPYFAVSGGDVASEGHGGSKRPRAVDPTSYYGAGSFYPPAFSVAIFNFPAVRIRGLPFNCYDTDIYKFFAGLDMIDCLLVNKNGRFSGEAFVVFSSPVQAEFALERNRQNMGRRYIEVFRCKKAEYYQAIAAEFAGGGRFDVERRSRSPVPRPKRPSVDKEQMEYTEVLKLRGLPYTTTESDIADFFGEFGVKEENVRVARRADGKTTGEGYVGFESAEVAKKAMAKDKMMIGPRYVELFPATPEEMMRAEQRFSL